MYLLSVVLLLLVLPAGATGLDLWLHQGADPIALAGKWFTFFAVGVRLLLAGIRQNLQPGFTAQTIFGVEDVKAFAIVREVGFGNLAMGAAGLLSLALPGWREASALVGGLYYGLAGAGHAIKSGRNSHETIALISDVLISALLLLYVISALAKN